eukprot:6479765-Alexandrium_andersonii.AAC.1
MRLTDVALRLRAEFPEEAKVGWGHICRDVGIFHVGRDEAAVDGAVLWLRDKQKRLGVRPANAAERARAMGIG